METVGPRQAKIFYDWLRADQIEDTISRLDESKWIPRFDGQLESYGRAWYLDIESGLLPLYHYEAEKTNRAIDKLASLKTMMISAATRLQPVGETFSVAARPHAVHTGIVRVPGWDSFYKGRRRSVTDKGGVAHSDLEGIAAHPEELWNFKASRAYSAVLCLKAPASGGGLRFWPRRRRPGDWGAQEGEKSIDFDYRPGSLVVFDSWCYHQILPSTYTAENPQRMIAAIHFLWRDLGDGEGYWEYWF